MITPRERIAEITRKWFFTEPALFNIYTSHELVANSAIDCAVRSGAGRVEYNPERVNLMSDPEFAEAMTVEMIRLALRHPYERQPSFAHPLSLKMGSDMVIVPTYKVKYCNLYAPSMFKLPEGKYFEWYVDAVEEMMMKNPQMRQDKAENDEKPEDSSSKGDGQRSDADLDSSNKSSGDGDGQEGALQSGNDGNSSQNGTQPGNVGESGQEGGVEGQSQSSEVGYSSDYTGLWKEDEEMKEHLKEVVEKQTSWGTLPGNLVDVINKALTGRIDYRKVLRAFQTSVISTNRNLTRMRPNRRFDFEQMGSKHDMSSRLLVAVDVSGSVTNEALAKFFRIVTQFFKYGVEAVDVIQFDTIVRPEVLDLKTSNIRAKGKQFKIQGRGGTNFQCVIDYLAKHNTYDGLIFFTDGYARVPRVDFKSRAKILWVTETEEEYNTHKEWMKRLGRACFIK